ncbi:MAG: helix-turn-helix domain-containing protein, partial [Lachnospiraceae bacterium]|nr:helix-turn-helix domain-containing protein [Lachnospiraceae bacterium]
MQDYFILETPQKRFTKDFQNFLKIIPLTITAPMSPLLEDESVLAYVVSGKGRIFINGISFELKPGSLCQFHSYHTFLIEPDVRHPLQMLFLVDDYTLMGYWGFFQNDSTTEIDEIFYLPPVIYPNKETQKTIEHIFDIFREEERSQEKHSLLIRSTLCARIRYLYQYICKNHPKNCAHYQPTPIWNIMIYITVYGSMNLNLEKLSALFHLPAAAINKELRRITNMSFSQFLARARINYASGALMLEHISLQSIAANSGFSSESSFFRQFYKYRGCTPKEYRRQIAAEKFQNPNALVSDNAYEILHYIICNFNHEISLKTLCNDLYMT